MREFTKLLLFSDLHLQEPGNTIIGLDPAARMRAALQHALAHHRDADRIVLLGDLTHHGRSAQYNVLKEILGQSELPVSFLLGNHDRRDAFLDVFPNTPVTSSGHVQSVVPHDGTSLITLDTLDGPPYPDRHHSGLLCKARLDWLETQLESAAKAPILLAMHHPPFRTGFAGMDDIRLLHDTRFWKILTRSHAQIHLICGHIHRTISGNAKGTSFTILKSPCHQMPMQLGLSGTGHSVDEPGAYGIALLSHDQIIVHTEDFALTNTARVSDDPQSN